MAGKIRFLGVRSFSPKAANKLEQSQTANGKIQKRELRAIFCAGEEEPEEVEMRDARTRQSKGRETFGQDGQQNCPENFQEKEMGAERGSGKQNTQRRLRFVCGDDDRMERAAAPLNDPEVWATQTSRQKFVQGDEDLTQQSLHNRALQTRLPRMRFRPIKNFN